MNETEPTHYDVRRASNRPQRIFEAGRRMLLQVVTVVPPPEEINELKLRVLASHTGVVVAELSRDDTCAVLEIKSSQQSVESLHRISETISGIDVILNAAEDPEAYAQRMYPGALPKFG